MDRSDLVTSRPAHAPPLVVIVDPDESFGILLQHFLEKLGYSTFCFSDARYALRLLRELHVDLLITSLDSNEIDGMELLVGLASEPRRTPVLLCTRHPSSGAAMIAATHALGVSQVLPRPCRFETIAGAVRGLIGQSSEPAVCAPAAETVQAQVQAGRAS
jgi:DNA-binding NtrC family response regulator